MSDELAALRAEVERLKAGRFTPEEVQGLCHNLKQTVGAQEFADGCAAYQRTLYGYAPDREPNPSPLLVYMTTKSRLQRSAAFLRTFAKRLLDKTAVTWEIPNTVATTLTDIADLLQQQDVLREHTDDSTIQLLKELQTRVDIPGDVSELVDKVIVELQDWDRSFELYHAATRVLDTAYKAAHPEVPDLVWPSTSVVTAWAATELQSLRERKDAAYEERNRVVAALSKVWPAHRARHPEEDASWERDWMTIVCIHSPAGQLTWHVHDSEVALFAHLPDGPNHWDGHDTPEKYRRLEAIPVQVEWTPTPEDLVTLRRALIDFAHAPADGSRWIRRTEHITAARDLLATMPWVKVAYPPEGNGAPR